MCLLSHGATNQKKGRWNIAKLPFIFKQVCLMPEGYGMPIGGVIACKNAIIPNAVGMVATKLTS